MAKSEQLGSAIDATSFTKEDDYNGSMIATMDQNGVVRRRRKGRLAGGVRDKLSMGIMKSTMAALWRDGDTYKDIAEKINVQYDLDEDHRITSHTIHYHIKAMLDYWRQKGLALMDERQAIILARFDQIESLALEAYFASMEGKETVQYNKQIERARSGDRVKQLSAKERAKREAEMKTKNRKGPKHQTLDAQTNELLPVQDMLEITNKKIQRNIRHEQNQAGDPKFLTIIFNINRDRAKILGLYSSREQLDGDGEAAKLTDEQRQSRVATIISASRERRQAQLGMLADPAPMGGFRDGETPPDQDGDWGFTDDEDDTTGEYLWD